jgi:hypothetical protein
MGNKILQMTVCFTTVVIMRFAFRCVVASILGTIHPRADMLLFLPLGSVTHKGARPRLSVVKPNISAP